MNIGISQLVENVGMGFENIILFVIIIAGLIFYARDYRIGVILHFVATGLLFIWFYEQNLNYVPSMISFFIFLILLSFSLYTTKMTTESGSFI